MRVLISTSCSFALSRKAVLRARELGAAWAKVDYMRLPEEHDPPSHCGDDEERFKKWQEQHGRYGFYLHHDVPRHDPILLQVFDELGAEGMTIEHEKIHEVKIPDDVTYFVGSYIAEWISEQHRTWGISEGAGNGGWPAFTIDSKFEPKSS